METSQRIAAVLLVAGGMVGCQSTPTASEERWAPGRPDRFDACLEQAARSSSPATERSECFWETNRAQR